MPDTNSTKNKSTVDFTTSTVLVPSSFLLSPLWDNLQENFANSDVIGDVSAGSSSSQKNSSFFRRFEPGKCHIMPRSSMLHDSTYLYWPRCFHFFYGCVSSLTWSFQWIQMNQTVPELRVGCLQTRIVRTKTKRNVHWFASSQVARLPSQGSWPQCAM